MSSTLVLAEMACLPIKDHQGVQIYHQLLLHFSFFKSVFHINDCRDCMEQLTKKLLLQVTIFITIKVGLKKKG